MRNSDGERILEYATTHDLVITKSIFKKRPSHVVATFYSGDVKVQIDFIVTRQETEITDAKIVRSEAVAYQPRPLVCKMKVELSKQPVAPKNGPERIK